MRRSLLAWGLLAGCPAAQVPSADCALPWGGALPDGESVAAFHAAMVATAEECRVERRRCERGHLTGSAPFESCEVETVLRAVAAEGKAQEGIPDCRSLTGTRPGAALVEVAREGHLEASVDYATADGSALAGRDYRPSSGTLHWRRDELLPKSVWIELVDDALRQPAPRRFTVKLFNPAHARLEGPTEIAVTIEDDDTPSALRALLQPSCCPLCSGDPDRELPSGLGARGGGLVR